MRLQRSPQIYFLLFLLDTQLDQFPAPTWLSSGHGVCGRVVCSPTRGHNHPLARPTTCFSFPSWLQQTGRPNGGPQKGCPHRKARNRAWCTGTLLGKGTSANTVRFGIS